MRKINWLNLEINEKIYQRILFIGIIIIFFYLLITFITFALPKPYKISNNAIIDESNVIKTGINSVYKGRIRLELSGWAYKEGQDIKKFNCSYVLKNIETEKMYLLHSEMKNIPELSNVDGTYDCSNSGLEAKNLTFGIKNGTYDIYILYKNDGENILANTGIQVNI